jgi:hypothetical protein
MILNDSARASCRRRLRAIVRAVLAGSVALAAAATLPRVSAAQQVDRLAVSDTIWEIRLTSGESYVGEIVARDGDEVTLRTTSGVRVQFARAAVASIRVAEGRQVGGAFWQRDPNATRLFFGPTGRTLRAGEGYVGVFELFFPFVSYGVTDWLTIAGGTPIVPQMIGQIVYFAPKVRVLSTGRFDVGAGVLAFTNFDSDSDPRSIGVLYGVGSWGTPDRAITAGAGWGFAGRDVESRPAFLVGGEARLSSRIKFITENYLITYREDEYRYPTSPPFEPEYLGQRTRAFGLLSGGVRIFGERLSADAGLGLGFAEGSAECCLPLVNFVYTFGSGR